MNMGMKTKKRSIFECVRRKQFAYNARYWWNSRKQFSVLYSWDHGRKFKMKDIFTDER